MRTLADLTADMAIDFSKGLSPDAVLHSRRRFAANRLTPVPREPIWRKFIEKFDEPIIKILLVAALLSMAIDLFKVSKLAGCLALAVFVGLTITLYVLRLGHWLPSLLFGSALVIGCVGLALGHLLVEGLAVMVAVVLATGVAFASEYKSDREFEILNARKESVFVKVLREGAIRQLPLEDVVVGDVVLLEMGDEVPADGRVIKAAELHLDQALMTGESEPVRKMARSVNDTANGPEQPGCLYRGTQVVEGVGRFLVTEVGDDTSLGQIARQLSTTAEDTQQNGHEARAYRVQRKMTVSKELTPLQQKLANLAEVISKVGYAAAALIFLAQIFRGLVNGALFLPGSRGTFGDDLLANLGELLNYFVIMVIIIVVAVPEGLPMSVTVSLALAMKKMTRAQALVRQLVACETIGSATVICSDKTGTLTQNKMQVARISWADQVYDRGQGQWLTPKSDEPAGTPLAWMILNAAVNSTANLEYKEGRIVTVGNTTEGALLQWLREGHVEYAQVRLEKPALYQVHFSSERKRMTTVIHHAGAPVVLVKGAPDWVVGQCVSYVDAAGQTRPLTANLRARLLEHLACASKEAMRTLAFAHALLPPQTPAYEEGLHALRDSLEAKLVYSGFVAIRDPLRADVKEAVAVCRLAGIDVKMITGDNVETARAIGYEVGLVSSREEPIDLPNAAIMTSARLAALSDDALKKQLPRLRVVARAKPLDKYRLVKALQELGEVVAVTGDGTNDAPALKKADVGLAMGITGTEVAKEASKIVLLDDAFSTIVKAVHWGRSLYENIQRFIQFQLTINVSALSITFLGILVFNVKAPFTVLQLLWLNVIMDTFASIALCSEPPRPGVMLRPPKRRDDSILTRAMLRTIFTTAGFLVVVMLSLLIWLKGGWLSGDDPVAVDGTFTLFQVTLFFSIYVYFQVWNQINCRSLTPQVSGFHRILTNPAFLAIAGAVAVGQILIVTFGGPVFQVEPLDIWTWRAIIAFTSTVLIFAEIVRRLQVSGTA